MRSKSLFLMVACVCGAIAAVGASQLIQGQGTATVAPTSDIFVASRVIEPTEQITPGMMTLESWPADRVPGGTTNDLSLLEGKYAGQRFFAGEPMMIAKLVESKQDDSVRIPDGFSVVSMRSDAAAGVAGLVQPGDRVNVIGYFTKSDQIPETGVRTVLRGIKVFAVDGRTKRSSESETHKAASTISLLIYQEDEEAWTFASELGRIRLSLSSPADALESAQTRASGAAFLQWLSDHQQPPLPEPVDVTPVTTPVISPPVISNPVVTPPVAERPQGFRMLKLHGGNWTEYEIPAGNLPAIITGSSDSGAMPNTNPEIDYGDLNESQSPFQETTSVTTPDESLLFVE